MTFKDLINNKPYLVLDGGMGTELASKGCEMGGISNIKDPEQVLAVHNDYIKAGADILITNTLTMNRISLQAHKEPIDLEEVNRVAVRLANKAAKGNGRLVFGDISSTGQLLKPYGNYSEEQFFNNFLEQASILSEEGIDGFIIETMTDLREATCALKACKHFHELPVIMSISFSTVKKGGRTMMGDSVSAVIKVAEEYGAEAVGANCGNLSPLEMADIADLFKQETKLPVIIQPNAGKPRLVGDETVFDMKPQEFVEGMLKCIKKGASIVGGCCGTTPAHINLLAEKVKALS